jgi:hypothetical protein
MFDRGESKSIGSIAGGIIEVGPGVAITIVGGCPVDLGLEDMVIVGECEVGWRLMVPIEADTSGIEVIGGGGGEESWVAVVKVVDWELGEAHESGEISDRVNAAVFYRKEIVDP